MNDLHTAITKAIEDYMNLDSLLPRQKTMLKNTHDKFVYNYDTVETLLADVETKDESSE